VINRERFFEQQTKMTEFLNSVFDIVDITVEDYLKRDFESLMISFGCTGGNIVVYMLPMHWQDI
jgi:Predicted P-loop-containing kinase